MDINDLLAMQVKMDESHGFRVRFTSSKDKYDQLTKDLVGLFGEIGEFSNIVKKINIKQENPDNYDLDVEAAETNLREELVDCFIYIMRLAAILKIDLDSETLKKIKINAARYARMQND